MGGQAKLDNECRRQTPDLHRIVAHASLVDSVRRWSRDLAEPSETVLVDSSSDEDSDPFEDCFEEEDHHVINSQSQSKSFEINAGIVHHVQNEKKTQSRTPLSPKRRPPPPPSSK